jgi:hypothetical protein
MKTLLFTLFLMSLCCHASFPQKTENVSPVKELSAQEAELSYSLKKKYLTQFQPL